MKNKLLEDLLTLLSTDGYKTCHKDMYPNKTELVVSNLTPRSTLHPWFKEKQDPRLVVFGLKYIIGEMIDKWLKVASEYPFDKYQLGQDYKEVMKSYLGVEDYNVEHIIELLDYIYMKGKLPIEIYGLEDYTESKFKQPILTIWNTEPEFFWLVNYLETYISQNSWQIMTSATISKEYAEIGKKMADKTASQFFIDNILPYQFHDFSARGMSSMESSIYSGLGHLAFSRGSDTIPAVVEYNRFFQKEGDLPIMTVPATEHSVMSAGTKEDELETYRRLLELFPTGILSVVSDTWSIWDVLTKHLFKLKEEILARDGKLVIRPDSGDPEEIICGKGFSLDETYDFMSDWMITEDGVMMGDESASKYGVLRLLDLVFGHTINDKGYKVLNEHVGLIYGDSITLERAQSILDNMERMGYSSENIVFGIGSFTYQYNTRDTFGFVVKATYIEIDGVGKAIYKTPVTDLGKKSAKGIVNILNGEIFEESTLDEIRNNSDFVKIY